MPKYLVLFAALALAFGVAQDDPVVLRVNSDEVRLSSFNERFNFYIASIAAQQGFVLTDELRPLFEPLRVTYLEQLVNERIALQLARLRGLSVDEAQLEAQLEGLKGSFADAAQYEAALAEVGITSERFLRELLVEAMLTQQLIDLLRSEIAVPDFMVRNFYAANAERFRSEAQACARHILVESAALADELALELAEGADFAELARDYSIDGGSAARGGDLGCFPRGVMVAPFEAAAFEGALGVVAPVETQFGFHLVLPYARREAEVLPLEAVRAEIEAELTQEIVQNVIQGYRGSVRIERFPELLGPAGDNVNEGGN